MLHQTLARTLLAVCLVCAAYNAGAQVVREPKDCPAEWSAPYQPFRIAGNLYYVGTKDLACYLLTGKAGHVLINTGLASSAAAINKSIRALGFKPADVKILLTTQAHYDHMGAMAALQQQTKARFLVSAPDADVVKDGGRSDYALGRDTSTFKPVKIAGLLRDKDVVQLGDIKLTLLLHPGHTKGSCSYLVDVKDNKASYRVLIANMPSIVTDQKFSAISAYPTIEKDYALTFNSMRNLNFDIWVASHASQFDMHRKHPPGSKYNPDTFKDTKGFKDQLADLEKAYKDKLAADKK